MEGFMKNWLKLPTGNKIEEHADVTNHEAESSTTTAASLIFEDRENFSVVVRLNISQERAQYKKGKS